LFLEQRRHCQLDRQVPHAKDSYQSLQYMNELNFDLYRNFNLKDDMTARMENGKQCILDRNYNEIIQICASKIDMHRETNSTSKGRLRVIYSQADFRQGT
jgi:hypothetical protein